MPSLDENRIVHVRQGNKYRCIHASLEMALRYVDRDVGVELSQACLASILGEPTTFATCEQRLNPLFEQDERLRHVSVTHAAKEPREHDRRRCKIVDALDRDWPVLMSLPEAFQGWRMARRPAQDVPDANWELFWAPVCPFQIRMCTRCDDTGVWMLDPGYQKSKARVFASWQTIEASVSHPTGHGEVLGCGDILVVEAKR